MIHVCAMCFCECVCVVSGGVSVTRDGGVLFIKIESVLKSVDWRHLNKNLCPFKVRGSCCEKKPGLSL